MWSSLKNYSDPALLVTRVVLGIILLCFAAWPPLRDAVEMWRHHGHHSFWNLFLVTLLAVALTLSAIFIIIGFWTRPSVLLFGIFAAIHVYHGLVGRAGFAGTRHEIELLLLLIVFFFVGPGRFSFDKA